MDSADDIFIGTWIEDGKDYFFTFRLPTSLYHILKISGPCVPISGHPLLLKDQSDVVIVGPSESLLQHRTFTTVKRACSEFVLKISQRINAPGVQPA